MLTMEQVMLNTNIFGRPYDDLSQKRIFEEAMASFNVFVLSATKFISIKSSDVLFAEIGLIKEEAKKELVLKLVNLVCQERVALNERVIDLADFIYPMVGDYMDSLHVAFSAFGNCDSFLTCDDGIIKHRQSIEKYLKNQGFKVRILNPLEFIEEMKE